MKVKTKIKAGKAEFVKGTTCAAQTDNKGQCKQCCRHFYPDGSEALDKCERTC